MRESESLNRIFHALSDPTRREILDRLANEACTISDLAEPFDMTFAAVSKHVRVLEHAGLIKREVDGRVHRCSADLEGLRAASQFIDKYKKFWEEQLDRLDAYFKKTRGKNEK